MFKNLKVGAKLGLIFGSLLTLMLIVGLLGLRNMQAANEAMKDIVGDNNLKMELANDLIDATNWVARIVPTAVMLDDPEAVKAEKEKLDKARAAYDKAWAALEKLPASDKGRAIRAKIKAGADETRPINSKVMELALADKDKEARELVVKAAEPATRKWQEAIYENLEFQKGNTEKAAAEAEAAYHSALLWMSGILVVATLFGAIFAFLVTRSISGPVRAMQAVLREVERNGDFSKRVEHQSGDEVGQAAAAFNSMMASLQSVIGDVGRVVGGVAQGNLSMRVTAEARGDLARLKDNINLSLESQQTVLSDVNAVMNGVAQGNLLGRVRSDAGGDLTTLKENINSSLDALGAAMRTIAANARQVATASGQTSTAIGQISDGAQNQMHAISQVVTAVKQTAVSVTDVSTNTEQASRKSQESVAIVREGKVKMDRMVDVVNSIAANSEKINKITEVIEKIANKTNLLSLNAAIEAARAGEHGKGFAVVAEEVGKLAANSAQSTQEIAVLVQQAVSEAQRAVATVKEVGADMVRIEEGSVMTDAMLKRIAVTMEQQSAAVQEINANAASLNKIAEANASASEEITATVVELSRIADGTRQAVERFSV